MSVVWSGVTESGAVVPVQVDSLGRVIATTGEPPGPPIIEYNGASAWGQIAEDGTLNGGLNCAVTRTGTGQYTVTFLTPLPNADYSIVQSCSSTGRKASYFNLTANGFDILTVAIGSGYSDTNSSFAVFSQNALPPMGGTGTDAWGSVQADATIDASFNIASVNRTATGKCLVTFTTPMPTANYAVSGSCNYDASAQTFQTFNKTSTSFEVYTLYRSFDGTVQFLDVDFQFSVNATSATLPLTVTREQINAVINNWQKTAGTLSTKDVVEMHGPVRFAGGKAGVTSNGEFYFTPGPGPEKYLLSVDEGQMQLKRIDSVY